MMAPMIDRRGLMQRAMLLLGATALAGCDLLPGSGAPAALGADRLKLLDAYADTLLPATDTPGALQAGVPRVLAQMYADWASDETREALSGALDRLDAAARRQTGKAFAELAAADRLAFLAAHDKAALAPVPLAPDAPKGSLFEPVISVADVGYHKLKELVVVSTSSCDQLVLSAASMPTCSTACTSRDSRFNLPLACRVFCPEMFFRMYSTSLTSFSFSPSKISAR